MGLLRRPVLVVAALCAAVAIAPSAAAGARAPRPWATVNICATPRHPDALGVRASKPGKGTRQRM